MQPEISQMLTEKILSDAINSKLAEHRGDGRALGECADITISEGVHGVASLYIWDAEFHDSGLVAKWFYGAGAMDVVITHVLYNHSHQVYNGLCPEWFAPGHRPWEVKFRIPVQEKEEKS